MPRIPHRTTKEKEYVRETRQLIEKIVVDAGVGRASGLPNFEEKALPQLLRDLALITGQKPQVRLAKKSIAGFKVREGQTVGLKVTIRRARMVDFFTRLITIVLPRVRDFQGIPLRAVDKGGTLNVGLREQFVFHEVVPEQSPISFSLGISIVPRAKRRDAAIEAYRRLGVPFSVK